MIHDVVTEDPDLLQAIEDKIPDVAKMRDLIAAGRKRAGRGDPEGFGTLLADMHTRAEKISIEVHDLIRLVSDRLDASRRSSMEACGSVIRELRGAEFQAVQREGRAHEALTRAQQEMAAATRARHHAQSKCLIFGIEVGK